MNSELNAQALTEFYVFSKIIIPLPTPSNVFDEELSITPTIIYQSLFLQNRTAHLLYGAVNLVSLNI